jgi:hypothetical protein
MKVAELIDEYLDVAVARALGHNAYRRKAFTGLRIEYMVGRGHLFRANTDWMVEVSTDEWIIGNVETGATEFVPRYSSDWSVGGPLIESAGITIRYWTNADFVTAYMPEFGSEWIQGPTALVAAMRCFVASKLGDEFTI